MATHLFTSESVTEGHPDKIADQISDAILDDILSRDPDARVACETLVTTGLVLVAGEIKTSTYSDIPKIVRNTIEEIGYHDANYGFDFKACSVLTAIDEQSPDIAMGVDRGGAGDQGMMFGFACDETPELMPLSAVLAHRLAHRLAKVRKEKILPYLRPDGKTQVTIEYDGFRALRVHTIVVSTQHGPEAEAEQIKEDVIKHVIEPVFNDYGKYFENGGLDEETIFHINPTGQFIIGGPPGDSGLTGRKIIVDTYGGVGRHGGGAFSGKDPTKVDRSGAYMARYVAKSIVASGLAKRCELQVAYAIGVKEPVSIFVDTFGTAQKNSKGESLTDRDIEDLVRKSFDFSPEGIIKELDLKRPIYKKTASYGHFGREEFTWERPKKIE